MASPKTDAHPAPDRHMNASFRLALCAAWIALAVPPPAEAASAPAAAAPPRGSGTGPLQSRTPECTVSAPGLRDAILDLQSRLVPATRRPKPSSGDFETLEASRDAAGLAALAREALVANPLVSGQPILYVARKQYRSDHHNTETFFQTGEINTGSYDTHGILKSVDLARVAGSPACSIRPRSDRPRSELSFDGRHVVFALRRQHTDDYHIHEISVDGSGLRQLTSAPGVTDLDPLYLPDGGIAFSSTRDPKYCGCNRHIMANLFRAWRRTAPTSTRSARAHCRGPLDPHARRPDPLNHCWEYMEHQFGDAQGLWTVNPDGTGHAVFWGNNTASPGGVVDTT